MEQELLMRAKNIQNEYIPKGYKKTKLGLVPQDWDEIEFYKIFEEVKETTNNTEKYPLYSLTIENGVTPKTERYERSFLITKEGDNYKVVHKDEFVYNPMNLRFGALARLKEDKAVCVSGYYNVFKIINGYSPDFIEPYLKSERMLHLYNSIATGSLIEKQRVHFSQFMELKLPIPPKDESNRIGEIFSTWDKAIELKEKLIEQKKELKKGLMQKLLNGEARPFGSNSKVTKVRLRGLIKEIKLRNKNNKITRILSVTNSKGFIEQSEQFDRQVASKDLSNYKVVKYGQFAYNPSRVNVGSIDLLTKFEEGVLSPMYVVFTTVKEKLLPEYLYQFLKSKEFFNQIKSLLQGSVRQNLSFDALELIKLYVPNDLNEQKEIVKILSTADTEIVLLEQELEALKQQKKGLMQLLLTGKVRVKV
jgi:type I restriction enzyme, S subunit